MSSASRGAHQHREAPAAYSMSSRLIGIIFTTAFGLVLLSSVLMYRGTLQVLRSADDQVIEKRMRTVADILHSAELDEGALGHEITEDNQGPRQIFIRVVSAAYPLDLETPGMAARLPRAQFPDMAGESLDVSRKLTIASGNGATYRAAIMRVPVGARAGNTDAIIEVATDTSLDKDGLKWLQRLLALVLAGALPLTAFASWLLVKRQLQPLQRISAAAQSVDSATIGQRLSLDGLPSELSDLGWQFNLMLDRLERTWSELKTYADTIAHEMRTPLNRLRLQSEIALRDAASADELRSAVASNIEECERMTQMLQSLLFLARAGSKQAAIHPQRLNAASELSKVADYFEASASAGGIAVSVVCDDQLLISADRELLQRALCNLVSNALAHTPHGGRVVLTAQPAQADLAEPAGVEISVADTGEGIAAEHHARIFDRFYRAPAAHNDASSDRLGLGLPLAQTVAELHGGRISVRSSLGVGSTFTIHLPQTDRPVSPIPRETSHP